MAVVGRRPRPLSRFPSRARQGSVFYVRQMCMKLHSKLLTLVVILASALTASAAESRKLHIELRISKTLEIDSGTRLAFGTDDTIEQTGILDFVQKEDAGFRVFESSYELKPKDSRHVLIVYHHRPSRESDQVFVLHVSAKAKPTDWTVWKLPDYYETDAVSNFRFSYVPADRSTNAQPNAFGLRYKIE